MKIYLLMILLLISVTFVSADSNDTVGVTITNNSIYISGYTYSQIAGWVSAGLFAPVNETLNFTFNCANETVQIVDPTNSSNLINKTYQSNCSTSLFYDKRIPLDINQSYTTIIGDSRLQEKYEQCIQDKAAFNAGLNSCVGDKAKYVDSTANYSRCTSDLLICNNDKSNVQKNMDDLNKKNEDSKNWPVISAVLGLAIGAGLTLYYKGHWGGPKIRPEDSFNPTQGA